MHITDLLFSYDGEADDPPPPTKPAEPDVKPEPEAAPAPVSAEPQQQDTNEQDVQFKAELDQPMPEARQEPQAARDDDYDKPLSLKEDG